jgi:hypothetical protein
VKKFSINQWEILEIRANLRDLVERQTSRSGASDENLGDELIAAQKEKLEELAGLGEATPPSS